jgi:hypothetical protein
MRFGTRILIRIVIGLVVGGILALIGVFRAHGGEPAPKADAPAVKPGQATDDGLKTMLENLGYDVRASKSSDGKPMYYVKLKRDTWEFEVSVALSSDNTELWLTCGVVDLPPTDKVPAEVLEKMLAKSDELGPTHFGMKKSRRVYLNCPIENKDVTPARLRAALDQLGDDIKGTEDLWNMKKWPGADAAAKIDKAAPAK